MATDNTQQTQQQGQQQAASQVPPELLTAQTTNDILYVPKEQLPKREVKGRAAQKALQQQLVGPQDELVIRTRRNPQGETVKAIDAQRYGLSGITRNILSATVSTDKLMNSKGEFSRGQYERKDAYNELRKLGIGERQALLKELYMRDMFPSETGPSSTGLDDRSIAAMEQFLGEVNTTGYTWDVAKNMVFAQYQAVKGPPTAGGAARKYTVTNPADIETVANRVSEEIIGRRISQSDMQRIIERVQSQERLAGLSDATETVSAASPTTIAQEAVEQGYQEDAQIMRMGRATGFIDQLMRSI